jgi:hypothetical protein
VTHPRSLPYDLSSLWTPRSTDHPRCQSQFNHASVYCRATVTPSSCHTAGNLLITPHRTPKIQTCTSEACRLVDPGTLSALPLKVYQVWGTVVEVGYGYPMPPGVREGRWTHPGGVGGLVADSFLPRSVL